LERTGTIEVSSEDNSTSLSYSLLFNVDNTGISKVIDPRPELYPNPANDLIMIKGIGVNTEFELRDVSGRILMSFNSVNKEYQLDISHLDPGIYFIKTYSGVSSFIKK
jgi:hypothetical protein